MNENTIKEMDFSSNFLTDNTDMADFLNEWLDSKLL